MRHQFGSTVKCGHKDPLVLAGVVACDLRY